MGIVALYIPVTAVKLLASTAVDLVIMPGRYMHYVYSNSEDQSKKSENRIR